MINELIELTAQIKQNPLKFKNRLKGRSVGLLFQKPSLRTKASFYIGALQLGAQPIYFSPQEVQLGERESIPDVAKTLSRYLDCVVLRTFSHKVILDFIRASTIPIINGLSDLLHPSQVLGDLFTLYELNKEISKIKFTYIGDGNNVCHSLIYAFSILGGNLTVASPKNYQPQKDIVKEAKGFAKVSGGKIDILNDPERAAKGADVLYTDVWASMGREGEKKKRIKAFKKFQVNDRILKLAKRDCIIMHCLPAHRGEEIIDSILDSRNSVVFLQAENRLHTAKAILVSLVEFK
jgi:ornithine carbamoyltransferase